MTVNLNQIKSIIKYNPINKNKKVVSKNSEYSVKYIKFILDGAKKM